MRAALIALAVWVSSAFSVLAQAGDVVWVQIEARPTLAQATERARAWSGALPDVNGFALRGGWYGILLGPYYREDAERVLQVYRSEGEVPRDSFIAFTSNLGAQFWPVGANILSRGIIAPPKVEEGATDAPEAETKPSDETPREARRSEAALSRDEKKALQIALQWAGHYDGAIDGAFGPGTRGSMSQWQAANGFEATGVLTTRQRAVLLRQYNAVLAGLGLRVVQDRRAGIEIAMPTEVVKLAEYSTPFARYDGTGEIEDAQVLLISQPGDQTTLFGLYDILQTLEVVPFEGPRQRSSGGFRITGENAEIVSETRVSLQDGEIKGFMLVWPTGDEDRRKRVLAEMEATFARLDGVLERDMTSEIEQDVDLLAGLAVRKPKLSRSGFFVDQAGTVVTTSDAVAQCARVTLDDEIGAETVLVDGSRGIAVLRPETALAPLSVARFANGPVRLRSEVAVAGYSYEGVLGAPSLTFGTLADTKGLRGEAGVARLAMNALPGDAGGPVMDVAGGVVGMLLPRPEGNRQLPDDVQFAAEGAVIREILAKAGTAASAGSVTAEETLDPVDLTERAAGMTVLVSCWD